MGAGGWTAGTISARLELPDTGAATFGPAFEPAAGKIGFLDVAVGGGSARLGMPAVPLGEEDGFKPKPF